jgi:hypothetical protein
MRTHGHADREALTVAMAVVPGIYPRNRMFSFYGDPEVRRAKARAAVIVGVVRHLAGSHGEAEDVAFARHGESRVLRYRVARVHLDRRVELTEIEAACLVYLAARAGVRGMHPTAEDRAHLDGALRRLAGDLRLATLEEEAAEAEASARDREGTTDPA